MVAIGVAAYLLLFRPERERQRRHQGLLANLKKNDRVVTTGGLCGTVSAVDREAGRVSLKVDESHTPPDLLREPLLNEDQ